MQLMNPRTGKKVRIGRLLKIHAKSREPIERAEAGEIVAALGVTDTATGDSLCDRDHPVALSQMSFPDPVISMSVEPVARTDRDRLSDSLGRLAREDPTFKVFTDQETGELIIGGMGELHLDVIRSRLLGEFKVETLAGPPLVAYRQALRRDVEVEGRHVKQSGGRGQFAVVKMRFTRGESGRDVEYESQVVGGTVPKEYHRAVGQGVQDIAESGGELRFPFVNVHAILYDGQHHEVDSSEMAFREAGRIAMRQAIEKVGTQILEPRMRFTVDVPQEYLGDVLSDLQSRRAEVQSLYAESQIKEIRGLIPVAELFSYSTTLRSLTQGRGTFHTEHANYAPVPENLAKQVIRDTLARRGSQAGKAGRAAG
jgi:elongation factor G